MYNPGDSGRLIISIRNDHPTDTIEIHNITIKFDKWFVYVKDHWEGNQTIKLVAPAFVQSRGGVYYKDDITFTVPTDGRGVSTSASIAIGTNKGYDYGSFHVNVSIPSAYVGFYELDKLITLMTIQQMILILCTVIIAATVFLGTRSLKKVEASKTDASHFCA